MYRLGPPLNDTPCELFAGTGPMIKYRSRTHHFNMDTFDKLLPEDLKINAVVMASFAYHAAMRDERIPRTP